MEWTEYKTKDVTGRYLFKFLPEMFLLEFIRTGNLWFSRSDKFGDKMECVRIGDLLNGFPIKFNELLKRQKMHLISCFHENSKETLAFWDTYAKNDEQRRKYALRFDRLELIKSIKNNYSNKNLPANIISLTYGKVLYRNLIGVNKEHLLKKTVKHVAFRKESAFAYEREYRFDISLDNQYLKEGYDFKLSGTG